MLAVLLVIALVALLVVVVWLRLRYGPKPGALDIYGDAYEDEDEER